MIVLGWLVVALLAFAGVMQVSVIRDRTIHLNSNAASCRWVIVAGVWGLSFRFGYLLVDGHFVVPWNSLFSIGLIAFGLIGLELPRFAPQAFMDTQPSEPVPLDDSRSK